MTKLMLSMMSSEHTQREETIEKESSFLQMYSVFCVLEESLCPGGVNSLGAKKTCKERQFQNNPRYSWSGCEQMLIEVAAMYCVPPNAENFVHTWFQMYSTRKILLFQLHKKSLEKSVIYVKFYLLSFCVCGHMTCECVCVVWRDYVCLSVETRRTAVRGQFSPSIMISRDQAQVSSFHNKSFHPLSHITNPEVHLKVI